MIILDKQEVELAAIWYHRPIQTETERTRRLTDGHIIRSDGDKIVDIENGFPATHKILGCYGTVFSQNLKMLLISLEDNTLSILDL